MNNLIFTINVGNEEKGTFQNQGHLKNFIKYLFSCSKAHTENENTHYNFYVKKDKGTQLLNRIGFIKNPNKQYEDFIESFSKEITNETKVFNDLFYVAFIIIIENKIITNMFEVEGNNIIMSLPREIIGLIVEDYFNGNESALEEEITKILNYGTDNNLIITNMKEINIEKRKEIEVLVHSSLISKNPNDNVLIEISHHDQEDHSIYHIHRLRQL